MADDSWGVAEAKAKFSEVYEKALKDGPQRISRRGKDAVLLVREADWNERIRPRQNVHEFFQNSPLKGSGIKIERLKGRLRDFDE